MGEQKLIPNPDYLTPEALATFCCQKTGGKQRHNGKGGFQVRCPAHEDTKPSLSISRGNNGGTTVYCHAGCTAQEIMLSLGLNVSQLFATSFAKGGASGLKPNNQVSAFTYSPQNTDDSNCSDDSNDSPYSITNTILQDIPRKAIPRNPSSDAAQAAMFNCVRWLKFDKGLNNGETIPQEALEILDAWRGEFLPKGNVMEFEEQVSSAWRTAKKALADSPVNTALKQAREKTPKTCPKKYRGSEYELFFGICYYLAEEMPDGIFFASTDDVADVLNLGYAMKSTRMFRVLVDRDILTKRPEFKENAYKTDRYQLNPDYSSDPERKNRITVASWHRYTETQIINMPTPNTRLSQFNEIQARHELDFNTEDFCRRGEAAHWKTDYGLVLTQKDMEAAAISFDATMPKKEKGKTQVA